MHAPGPPHDEYGELVARVQEARAVLEEAVSELAAFVRRAEAELTDEQRRDAEALTSSHPSHRRGFHPPPS